MASRPAPASGLVPSLAAFTAPVTDHPSIKDRSPSHRLVDALHPLRHPAWLPDLFLRRPRRFCAWSFSLMHCPFHFVGAAALSGRPKGRKTDVSPDSVFRRIVCA
ncbi:uncharacterized protein N7518_005044 [Penicillium psychrosexuale]|uniref:uncharacterized protein n=1 Tax=Penicillium psychrosexuale TaxID=1002107 RepID=UPI002544EA05|nr:uncharacterized protein N7518_005044 [Penicillium psychrosexuale]KAJ5796504.1 hypothetical protein N7518_005044 [Penicillium psychrosexuale]